MFIIKLYSGPFQQLTPETITDDLQSMWRAAYKMSKTFSDQPAPRRIAEGVKNKIDKFKVNLPVLITICNPGIKDRHWDEVGNFLRVETSFFCE